MEAVYVAVITGVVGPLLLAWFTRRQLSKRVGTPNGSGTLTEMAEQLLAGQATQDERLARLEARQAGVEARLSDLERGR
jgi:hypothetical protein